MRLAVKSHVERLLHAAPSLLGGERRFWGRGRGGLRLGSRAIGIGLAGAREPRCPPSSGHPARSFAARGLCRAGRGGARLPARDALRPDYPARARRLDKALRRERGAHCTLGPGPQATPSGSSKKSSTPAGAAVSRSADRAGTTFALLATSNDGAARDDPGASGRHLPEDIQDAELQSHYGGVGGPLFRSYAAEVERRLWSCPAYRALATPVTLNDNGRPSPLRR